MNWRQVLGLLAILLTLAGVFELDVFGAPPLLLIGLAVILLGICVTAP